MTVVRSVLKKLNSSTSDSADDLKKTGGETQHFSEHFDFFDDVAILVKGENLIHATFVGILCCPEHKALSVFYVHFCV